MKFSSAPYREYDIALKTKAWNHDKNLLHQFYSGLLYSTTLNQFDKKENRSLHWKDKDDGYCATRQLLCQAIVD